MQSMKLMLLYLLLPFTLFLSLWSSPPVPYSGKIDIRGVNYFGEGQFAFSLHDGNGTTHWRNGSQAGETIKVSIHNGRYSVLLGGQGMNSLPPELFLNHDKLYLKVEFDNGDGEGLRHLAPDQLITATPRALVAEWAKMSKLAEGVSAGSITRDMLSQQVLTQLDANGSSASMGQLLDMLPASVLNDLNKTIVITRDMLPQDVRDDLNKTTVITRQMLPADVLADLNHSISAGSISLNMLAPEVRNDLNRTITKSMLGSDVLADLNKTVTITRDMLPQDVRDDLNKTITITRNMLPADVLSDLNRTITKQMLGNDVLTDINATIGMNRLSSEVTEKLNQNKTTTNYNAPSVGSLLAVPSGSDAPSGYSLYQRGEPKELVWEEKAPVSVARNAFDGVEVLDGKIYFVGGYNGSAKNIAERYDPLNDTWEILSPMSVARSGIASAISNGKLYAIGGSGLSSVEIYDPSTNTWSLGPALPHSVNSGCAIVANENLYHIGGWLNNQNFKFVHMLDPNSNSWTRLADMPTARHGLKLVWFDNRIWAVGGYGGLYLNTVESFDPLSNSWRTEASMTTKRNRSFTFVANGEIFVAGGNDGSSSLNSIEAFDPTTNRWKICEIFLQIPTTVTQLNLIKSLCSCWFRFRSFQQSLRC